MSLRDKRRRKLEAGQNQGKSLRWWMRIKNTLTSAWSTKNTSLMTKCASSFTACPFWPTTLSRTKLTTFTSPSSLSVCSACLPRSFSSTSSSYCSSNMSLKNQSGATIASSSLHFLTNSSPLCTYMRAKILMGWSKTYKFIYFFALTTQRSRSTNWSMTASTIFS